MNDERLQSLYRRFAASQSDRREPGADDIDDALSRGGYPEIEGTPLDRIAGSPAHAGIVRAALALQPDISALGRDLAALRRPAPHRVPARGWMALAAGVGAAAILIAGLRGTPAPDGGIASEPASHASDVILTGSFERPRMQDQEIDDARPIFRGGFDS